MNTSERPRYKVADPERGVFLGDTPTAPIRQHAAGGPAPAPAWTSPMMGVLTWLANRWWQWTGAAWQPIARAAASTGWSTPMVLDEHVSAWAREWLERSGREPVLVSTTPGTFALVTAERGAPAVRMAEKPGNLSNLAPPPVAEVSETFRDVYDSMRKCAEQIARDFRRRRVLEDARQVIHEARLPGPRGKPDRRSIVWALFEDQKRRATFHDDPTNTEHVGSTEAILCLDPDGACLRGGDCDDQIVALGSRSMALGVPVRLRARRYAHQRQLHVVLEFDAARRGESQWEAIDPSTESGRASEAPYLEQIVQTIDVGPAFVGLGEPEDLAMLGAATTGTAASSSTPMDATLAAGWIAYLAQVKTSFDESLSELQAVATDYAAMRSRLGLAATDDAAGSSQAITSGDTTTGSATPLGDYLASVQQGAGVWTSAAQAAEQKLITAATFLSTALGDGLNGTRALSYDTSAALEGGKADLFIAAQDGDPYRVLLVKNSTTGVWTPQYIDPTTSTPSTLGAIGDVAIVAVAVAVVSLAAAYGVHVYMDTLRQTHTQDMLQHVNDNQTQLIAAGQMTPDQAAAQTAALGQAGAALNPSAQPTVSSIANVVQWLAIGAAAVSSVFLAKAIAGALSSGKR